MPNVHVPLVNQKLANAAELLVMAQSCAEPRGAQQVIGLRALLESTMLQLHQAYLFYLRELGENYGLKAPGQVVDTSALATALEASGRSAGEAAELIALQNDKNSWLARIQLAFNAYGRSPERRKEPKAFSREAQIQVIDVTQLDEGAPVLTLADLILWQADFRALVLRQRETSAEY